MSISLSRSLALLALAFSTSLVFAQAPTPRTEQKNEGKLAAQPIPGGAPAAQPIPGRPTTPGAIAPPTSHAASPMMDQNLVAMAILCNNKEIAIGKLGKQHAKHQKVQAFADMLVKDHGDFVAKLQSASVGSGQSASRPAAINTPTTGTRPGAVTTLPANPGEKSSEIETTVAKPVISNAPGSEMLQLHQEIVDECLKSAKKDAEKHSGEKFDMMFVGSQIVAHKQMLGMAKVFERHSSPELAKLFKECQETTSEHLAHAEKLIEELADKKPSDSKR